MFYLENEHCIAERKETIFEASTPASLANPGLRCSANPTTFGRPTEVGTGEPSLTRRLADIPPGTPQESLEICRLVDVECSLFGVAVREVK